MKHDAETDRDLWEAQANHLYEANKRMKRQIEDLEAENQNLRDMVKYNFDTLNEANAQLVSRNKELLDRVEEYEDEIREYKQAHIDYRNEIAALEKALDKQVEYADGLRMSLAESRENDRIAMSWINDFMKAANFKGTYPEFVEWIEARHRGE